jgi:hypothetical protein
MRQSHAAGDKLVIDYVGDSVPVVIDRLTGERRAGGSCPRWWCSSVEQSRPDARPQ